jgi:hypothetical protein
MDPPPNRIVEFCRNSPVPTVVRAKVRVSSAKAKRADIEVERVWGTTAPTNAMADHFAANADDETLLVSLAPDGKVLGTSWPVFREQVSLELGIPDMKEEEAASLLRSPKCADELRAFRDHGVRPTALPPTSTGGCAHCDVGGTPFDPGSAVLVVAALVFARIIVRPKAARAPLSNGG